MTRALAAALPGLLLLGFGISPARAQEPSPSAHVAYVEGRAILEHDTTAEDVEPNVPLEIGDRLRTERGRLEVLFGDGSLLQLDEDTTIDVLSDGLIRQLAGRTAIVAGSARAGRLQVDTPAGSVRIGSAGEYRVGVFEQDGAPEVELAVIRGSAELISDRGVVTVTAGTRALARQGEYPSQPIPFNSARWDAFDQWSQDRLAQRRGAASARYVPAPLQPYGTVFDAYGAWNYEPTYGYVWFPRVAPGWRPYCAGRWRFYGRFGWTWTGGSVWSWPTHHYGRWGITSAGAWYWIPGSTWGAAWVHWAVAPGYVSWCPLGFYGRPVVPFGYTYASRPYHGYDPWRAWTVVRREHFGGYRHVAGVAVDGRRLDPESLRPFVSQTPPPARARVATAAPARSPARADVGERGAGPARGMGVAAPRGTAGMTGQTTASRGVGVAVPRGTASLPGQTAASRDWGRDMRWTNPPPATATTSPSWRRSDPTAPGSGWSRGDETTRPSPSDVEAGSVAVPRGSARPAWSPDSVPVYRGGVRSQPELRPAPRSPGEGSARPSRRLESGAVYAPPRPSFESPRAVPRAAPSYVPMPGPQPPSYGRRGAAPSAPSPGPAYRGAPAPPPARSAPPAAAPRQNPSGPGRGVGLAAPRGAADSGRGAPPAAHRARGR